MLAAPHLGHQGQASPVSVLAGRITAVVGRDPPGIPEEPLQPACGGRPRADAAVALSAGPQLRRAMAFICACVYWI